MPPLNPAFRRVPVSLVVIVHPDHVDNVLTTFNNSRLRFLTTQFLINQTRENIQPLLPEELASVPAGGFRQPARPKTQPVDDNLTNNLELVLYGIVTLFERYPPPLQ